jgi:hypothetical protein
MEAGFGRAYRLGVDVPIDLPDFRGDLIQEAGFVRKPGSGHGKQLNFGILLLNLPFKIGLYRAFCGQKEGFLNWHGLNGIIFLGRNQSQRQRSNRGGQGVPASGRGGGLSGSF